MSRRRQERSALRELERRVWGEKTYQAHRDELRHNRQRRASFGALIVGGQLLLLALAMFVFVNPASAHTSQISITCTQVEFNYAEFPQTSVTAHESVVIDGVQGPKRDFQFTGPTAIDIITIAPGSGTHTVTATTNWTFFGQPQGSGTLTQEVSDCGPPETTSTTTSSTSTTSTSTTVPPTSTTISSETTLPTTTTTSPPINTTTTFVPRSTTTMTVRPQGSTTTSIVPLTTTVTFEPPPSLPFTGSSTRPISFALGTIGLGAIALGLGRLKRAGRDD